MSEPHVRFVIILLALVLPPGALSAGPTCHLVGEVVDANNNPVRSAEVQIQGHSFETGDDGVFLFRGLRPGPHEVSFRRHDSPWQKKQVSLKEDQTTRQVLRLTAERSQPDYSARLQRPSMIVPNVGVNSYGTPSPDGKRIAVEVLASRTEDFDIWVIDPTGHKLREIVSSEWADQNPRWSPDGTRLVFHQRIPEHRLSEVSETLLDGAGYRVLVVDIESGSERVISGGLTPAWSPDGKWVVYAKWKDGNSDIYKRHIEQRPQDRFLGD